MAGRTSHFHNSGGPVTFTPWYLDGVKQLVILPNHTLAIAKAKGGCDSLCYVGKGGEVPRDITLSLLCWLGHGLTTNATKVTQERDFIPEDALPRALYLYEYLYL